MKPLKRPSWRKGIKSYISKEMAEYLRFEFKKLYLQDKMRRKSFLLPIIRKIKGQWINIDG